MVVNVWLGDQSEGSECCRRGLGIVMSKIGQGRGAYLIQRPCVLLCQSHVLQPQHSPSTLSLLYYTRDCIVIYKATRSSL